MLPPTLAVQSRLAERAPLLAVHLPGGQRLGAVDAKVRLTLHAWSVLPHLAAGRVGALAMDHVEGLLDIEGAVRDVVEAAANLVDADPTAPAANRVRRWWDGLHHDGRSRVRHTLEADARQIEFHYDVSDDFYALWLDARRIYSCAYWRPGVRSLDAAQEAKLEHLCRKLMLAPGQRLLDVGAGWGGLLLWAAEHHGVDATGITLSRHQQAHVQRLIDERGLGRRVRMLRLDYRALPEDQPYDRIASIGMFEHVGRAQLPAYFGKLHRLLAPGGLLMNHGITAGGTRNTQLGAGIGDFVERYIFPGGELMHASHVMGVMAEAGWETLDVECLRPHYARTLWAWSDALEARRDEARALSSERVLRAYRLYLAGSAVAFERGWMSLHQMLASRPNGRVEGGAMRGAQSVYPFTRDHVHREMATF